MDTDTAFETARLLVEDMAEKFENPTPNRMDIYMRRAADLVAVVAGLRVKRLGYLAAITGLDPGVEEGELEVLYHFCTDALVITLRVSIPKSDASVPSLCEIIPSAESFERELGEMFGISVVGLRNPKPLYLPDDWSEGVYPLRKDFSAQSIYLRT